MLKRTLNELIVNLTISPDGPVLIKSSSVGLGTDMAFVTTYRNNKKEVYLPGSSLKGVIRSHCERICRTLQPKSVCEPFDIKETDITNDNRPYLSCGFIFRKNDYWSKKNEGDHPYSHYKASCPACRMFGSLNFKGRCFIDDAYAQGEAPKPHIRDGVGIDRFTGATKPGAKYDFEVITQGDFATQIRMTNFEMWQLELLSFALSDLCDSNIRIGMASSRGLGKIKTKIESIEYQEIGKKPEFTGVSDISLLEKDSREKQLYGFDSPRTQRIPLPGTWETKGIRHSLKISIEEFSKAGSAISGVLADYLDRNPERNEIKKHYYNGKV
ncbi:MAG: hypothetical protein HUU50_08635 [Candidatus Brocadiae bacterium]|nr:hypothetical protein [Candidatus Brocadiia bacterium]